MSTANIAGHPATESATAQGLMGEIAKAFGPLFQSLMKEGALSVKQKELIALGVAVAVKCEPCITAHTEKCLAAGATKAELMEAAGVAVVMGGGPAYTHAPIVAKNLIRLGA